MQNSVSLKHWIAAARLRTLPLALSTILLGSLLAAFYGQFNVLILLWCFITATFYQVLSNFANDLGDGLKGTDSQRTGEQRAVASGIISISQMKRAVVLFAVLSLVSGSWLSYIGTLHSSFTVTYLFIGLGFLAVLAALKYTLGKRAYGYSGWGDLFVILFFGWVGVIGSFFLQTNLFKWELFLPATAVGMLATGVLNLNNLRDVETDETAAKNTLVVKIGRERAKIYQVLLLLGALLLQTVFVLITKPGWGGFAFLLVSPLLLKNLSATYKAKSAAQFDPLLKPLAITTLLFCLSAGLGQNFNHILIALNIHL